MTSAGRALRNSPKLSWPILRSWGQRFVPVTRSPRCKSFPPRGRCCSMFHSAKWWPSRARSCPIATGEDWRATATARASSRWTGRSTARSLGLTRIAAEPARFISPARSKRWRSPSELPGTAANPERPYVLLGQQSACDPSRAPVGQHTLWAYCHVPAGSRLDMTDRIESQIERFAPGFRDRVVGRHTFAPAELEGYNANLHRR